MYVRVSLSLSANTVVRSTSYSLPKKISPVATASSFTVGTLFLTVNVIMCSAVASPSFAVNLSVVTPLATGTMLKSDPAVSAVSPFTDTVYESVSPSLSSNNVFGSNSNLSPKKISATELTPSFTVGALFLTVNVIVCSAVASPSFATNLSVTSPFSSGVIV